MCIFCLHNETFFNYLSHLQSPVLISSSTHLFSHFRTFRHRQEFIITVDIICVHLHSYFEANMSTYQATTIKEHTNLLITTEVFVWSKCYSTYVAFMQEHGIKNWFEIIIYSKVDTYKCVHEDIAYNADINYSSHWFHILSPRSTHNNQISRAVTHTPNIGEYPDLMHIKSII